MSTVRPGEPADLARLREIQAAALPEPWPALLDAAIGDGPLVCVVECSDGNVVGYAVALSADEQAYLPEIAVAPDQQREGFGTALLDATIAALRDRGVERARLTARLDADGLLAFYRRQGFEAVDRVPDHFETGDGVVLERQIETDES